ncbi:hypothetical protein PsorP6_018220 [Peronosclerospora sorghi]|uniref:Uncharacterized protein n=1 Tax=Peronosclerospora sorghi TaxID=230839 RepID=A0ACC0WF31_9STRA|nr:hypothetical protein PsorP6_018220 [Peronosclerospora sorghi]
MHRSNTRRAPFKFPNISSINAYLYQNCATRGNSVTARSHTFRAWLTNLCRISISAYLSQIVVAL